MDSSEKSAGAVCQDQLTHAQTCSAAKIDHALNQEGIMDDTLRVIEFGRCRVERRSEGRRFRGTGYTGVAEQAQDHKAPKLQNIVPFLLRWSRRGVLRLLRCGHRAGRAQAIRPSGHPPSSQFAKSRTRPFRAARRFFNMPSMWPDATFRIATPLALLLFIPRQGQKGRAYGKRGMTRNDQTRQLWPGL